VIVAEVDRLRWRIWNGKATDATVTLERIRQVVSVFQGEQKRDPSSRRLWTALREIDRYLTSQSAWLVNDAERHRAGSRVGTSLTEGTANFLVNRRMNKSQPMRWSRRGDASLFSPSVSPKISMVNASTSVNAGVGPRLRRRASPRICCTASSMTQYSQTKRRSRSMDGPPQGSQALEKVPHHLIPRGRLFEVTILHL